MLSRFSILSILLGLLATLYFQDLAGQSPSPFQKGLPPNESKPFFKIIPAFTRGHSICLSGDGNLYVAGRSDWFHEDRLGLLKVTPSGKILSAIDIELDDQFPEQISEIIMDSDGMIAGCGTLNNNEPGRGFVFRFNPLTQTMLWVKILEGYNGLVYGLLEKSPGGNYWVYGTGGGDAELLEIQRNTGNIVPDFAKRYNLGRNESFNGMVAYEGAVYAVGRFTNTNFPFSDPFVRNALTKLDTAAGAPVWSNIGIAPTTAFARLLGRDLIVDEGSIVSTFSGNEKDHTLANSYIFLQKTTLDGDLVWVQKYDLPAWHNEIAEEVISVPDGYVLYGRSLLSDSSRLFVLKTDKQGNPLWARRIDYQNRNDFSLEGQEQGQIITLNGDLFFTAYRGGFLSLNGAMMLIKINGDGDFSWGCQYITPTQVEVLPLTDPVLEPVNLQISVSPALAQNAETFTPHQFQPHTLEACQPGPIQDTCLYSRTYARYCGIPNVDEAGTAICAAKDGGVFGAGFRNDSTLLMKLDGSGQLAWARTLMLDSTLLINTILEDSDGELVGTGEYIPSGGDMRNCIAFRYDPQADTMIWIVKWEHSVIGGILETGLGGNFLVYSNQISATAGYYNNLFELNRATGAVVNGTANSYSGNFVDKLVVHNGYLYGLGHEVAIQEDQTTLAKYDLYHQTPIWVRRFEPAPGAFDELIGLDLLIDQDTIVSLSVASNPLGGINNAFFLQKNDLDGHLIWRKRYVMPNLYLLAIQSLEVLGDAYFVVGSFDNGVSFSVLDQQQFIVKLNKHGEVVWAQQFAPGFEGLSFSDHATVSDDALHLISTSLYYSEMDISVLKMDSDGNAGEDCPLFDPLDVKMTAEIDIQTHTVQTSQLQAPLNTSHIAASVFPAVMLARAFCASCGTPPCSPVMLTENLEFCPGSFVTVGGIAYDQPGIVTDTLEAGDGCDTIVTYNLQFVSLPQPSFVSISCPANLTVQTASGENTAAIDYTPSDATTDCPCGEALAALQQGLPSGSDFPVGTTLVCYRASDDCGNSATCCFNITVEQTLANQTPCDVKNTACVKYEILGIYQNPFNQKTYRMRVTNKCADPLIYTAFQLPKGLTAAKPVDYATYTAPSGRKYEVRNPNFSPIYSIRFKAIGTGIANGQSDILEYTLPPQASQTYINAITRLYPQTFYEAHTDVFDCPVQQTSNRPEERSGDGLLPERGNLSVFPNPALDLLFVKLPAWEGLQVQVRVMDIHGRWLAHQIVTADGQVMPLELLPNWPAGMYHVQVNAENGATQSGYFVKMSAH